MDKRIHRRRSNFYLSDRKLAMDFSHRHIFGLTSRAGYRSKPASRAASPLKTKPVAGFTLIEMLVAVALFLVVMVIALGALLSIVKADSRAQNVGYMANDLDFVFDDMSRSLRTGSAFYCAENASGGENDCYNSAGAGGTMINLLDQNGSHVMYWFSPGCTISPVSSTAQAGYTKGCVEYNKDNTGWLPITPSSVDITHMSFYVRGVPGSVEPSVFITLTASLTDTNTGKPFSMHLQTLVTQRIYGN